MDTDLKKIFTSNFNRYSWLRVFNHEFHELDEEHF